MGGWRASVQTALSKVALTATVSLPNADGDSSDASDDDDMTRAENNPKRKMHERESPQPSSLSFSSNRSSLAQKNELVLGIDPRVKSM